MTSTKPQTRTRRGLAASAAALSIAALGVGMAPSAQADDLAATARVNIKITNGANFTADAGAQDNTTGIFRNIGRGRSENFTLNPNRGESVTASVRNGSGADRTVRFNGQRQICFRIGGNAARPSINQVGC
jgi:hypothetical protein